MTDELSFAPIFNMIDSVAALTTAFQKGNTKFLNSLPTMFKEQINILASQRLNHSAANFKESVLYDLLDDVLVVTIDPKNWLANATEEGTNSWPMISTHLKGSKVKISKEGKRYKVIPLRAWTTSPAAKTELGMSYFNKVKATLKKPRYGAAIQKQNPDGSISVRQEVISNDSELEGMFRVREYASQQALLENQKPKQTQYVLFRTMSEKYPEKWVHPGIKPANILKDAKTQIENELEQKWNAMIQAELQKKGFS